MNVFWKILYTKLVVMRKWFTFVSCEKMVHVPCMWTLPCIYHINNFVVKEQEKQKIEGGSWAVHAHRRWKIGREEENSCSEGMKSFKTARAIQDLLYKPHLYFFIVLPLLIFSLCAFNLFYLFPNFLVKFTPSCFPFLNTVVNGPKVWCSCWLSVVLRFLVFWIRFRWSCSKT